MPLSPASTTARRRSCFAKCAVVLQLIAAILSVSISSCQSHPPAGANSEAVPSSPSIVATVDSHPVPASLYELYLDRGMRALNFDPAKPDDRRPIEQLKEGVVLSLIDKEILLQEAARRGIAADESRIDQRLTESVGSFGGSDRFNKYLAELKVSADDFRSMLRLEETESLMSEELSKSAVVEPSEIQRYYAENSHRAEFMLPERVHAGRIFIATDQAATGRQLRESGVAEKDLATAVAAKMEERRKLAAEIQRRAAAGANFVQLAKQHSDDAKTRDRGGDLGWLERDEAEDRQQLFLFSLQPNEVSGVRTIAGGYEIYKIWDHQARRVQSPGEAGPRIAEILRRRKQSEILNRWLEHARAAARVEVAVNFRFGDIPARFPGS